ncbi:MAG: Mucin-21 [Icmadophila ericetorum]|nr:Mucin-21 [Icmadophila ericetorum]
MPTIEAQEHALEARSPHNLHPARFSLDVELLVRRNEEIQKKLADSQPSAVHKMSEDQGEMFFLEYWQFGAENHLALGQLDKRRIPGIDIRRRDDGEWGNSSISLLLQPPLLLHSGQPTTPYDLFKRLPVGLFPSLDRRDFQCPTGTSSCTSINQPETCCPNGDTCVSVQNTGSGTVACCPAGQTCSGAIDGCPAGYTACSSSSGGGCCIPGYQCSGAGCILVQTTVVVIEPTVTASSSSKTSTATPAPAPTTTSSTTSSTPPPSTSTSTSPSSPPSTTSTSTSLAPAPPVLPTSQATTTFLSTASLTPLTPSMCPTGFYVCSAYYPLNGCCRVGRDCSTSSCPPLSSTTAFVSDGVTVVVNNPTATASVSGCPLGWFSCGSSGGGGCCPGGYACGQTACTLVETGTGGVATGTSLIVKETAASWGTRIGLARGWGALVLLDYGKGATFAKSSSTGAVSTLPEYINGFLIEDYILDTSIKEKPVANVDDVFTILQYEVLVFN